MLKHSLGCKYFWKKLCRNFAPVFDKDANRYETLLFVWSCTNTYTVSSQDKCWPVKTIYYFYYNTCTIIPAEVLAPELTQISLVIQSLYSCQLQLLKNTMSNVEFGA